MASSSESGKGVEFRVGLFVLAGLVILGYMVVEFGRFGIGVKSSYPLTVELPNANGLLKNSKVLMSGALVGSVIDDPKVLDHARGVRSPSSFTTPSSPTTRSSSSAAAACSGTDTWTSSPVQDEGGYYQAGETVHGTRAQGMEEIQREGGLLVGDLRDAVATLHKTLTRVEQELLKEQTFKDLQAALANLRVTTENFPRHKRKTLRRHRRCPRRRGQGGRRHGRRQGHARQRQSRRRRRARRDWRCAQGARHGAKAWPIRRSTAEGCCPRSSPTSNSRKTWPLWFEPAP